MVGRALSKTAMLAKEDKGDAVLAIQFIAGGV